MPAPGDILGMQGLCESMGGDVTAHDACVVCPDPATLDNWHTYELRAGGGLTLSWDNVAGRWTWAKGGGGGYIGGLVQLRALLQREAANVEERPGTIVDLSVMWHDGASWAVVRSDAGSVMCVEQVHPDDRHDIPSGHVDVCVRVRVPLSGV